jgi:hypothetical protein
MECTRAISIGPTDRPEAATRGIRCGAPQRSHASAAVCLVHCSLSQLRRPQAPKAGIRAPEEGLSLVQQV